MKQKWLSLGREELAVERQQLQDEGRDIGSLAAEFDALADLDIERDPVAQARVNALLDLAQSLPLRADYPFHEPSDLEGIQAARPDGPRTLPLKLDDETLDDRVLGAWLGRCAGCLLGKPVEGWHSGRLWGYLRDLGSIPWQDICGPMSRMRFWRATISPGLIRLWTEFRTCLKMMT